MYVCVLWTTEQPPQAPRPAQENANKKGQHCDGAVVDDVVHAAAAAVVQSHRRRITLVMPAQELEVAPPYYIHCTVVVAMSLMEFCTMFTSILTICNCS